MNHCVNCKYVRKESENIWLCEHIDFASKRNTVSGVRPNCTKVKEDECGKWELGLPVQVMSPNKSWVYRICEWLDERNARKHGD